MKLFDDFEAVKFYQENMIFITRNGYLYYIYSHRYHNWSKHPDAGNDRLTVANYADVSKEELTKAMNGIFPKKETDFMRLCSASQLCIRDMMHLLQEDYAAYMSDGTIYETIHCFLLESYRSARSFERIQALLKSALFNHYNNHQVVTYLKRLSFKTIGRDIFKKEISITDGLDSTSAFAIMPVRVIDYYDTEDKENLVTMKSVAISIEEDDVGRYLFPFLDKHFDINLKANKRRLNFCEYGFSGYYIPNFFTLDSVTQILKDIAATIDALSSGRETAYTKRLRFQRNTTHDHLPHTEPHNNEEHNDIDPKANHTTVNKDIMRIIAFYQRFLYWMEYMIRISKENGYKMILFQGP